VTVRRTVLPGLLFACVSGLHPAHGAERVGDAIALQSLHANSRAETALESELLSLIETASGDNRFPLYRIYNRLIGAWLQVDLAQVLLELAMEAESASDEEETRTTLRDQTQFALRELDDACANPERDAATTASADEMRMSAAVCMLIIDARSTISRLAADQCALMSCAEAASQENAAENRR